jgi:hypothetical protein
VIGVIFATGVSSFRKMASACQGKANLHPLVFTQSNLRHQLSGGT